MRTCINAILLIIVLMVLSSCSNQDSNSISGGLLPGNNERVSLDSLPVIAFDGSSALGLFGAYNLSITQDSTSADLVPMRSVALGESYIVSGEAFFTMTPCRDCLKIKNIALDTDGNIILGMIVKHPFPKGDTLKPPSAANRLDLDVFDLALVVQPLEATAQSYPLTGSSAYTGILVNADGYTGELNQVVSDTAALPYKICFEDVNNNRFEMGTDYKDFQIVLSPGGSLQFDLYLTMGYGASAKKAQRLNPTYYVPEFNRKAAWKVVVTPPEGTNPPAMGNTWDDNDTTTEFPVTIDIYDWNHGATIAGTYPDPANTNQISAESNVGSVTVEIPGMTSSIVTAATTDTTTNGWDDPLTYTAQIANQNALPAGVYNGLVKVTDTRIPGTVGVGGETNTIVHTPDGIALNWVTTDEFATYQVFKATVVIGALPPVCDLNADPTTIGQGGTVYADPGTSNDPDGTITMYEYDADYDGITFDIDASQVSSDPDFGDPVGLAMPCNTTGNDITITIAIRVTDDSTPPLSTRCTQDITVQPKMGSPRKVTADTVNRGESGANTYRITSVDLAWPNNPCAVEYLIQRADNGMSPSVWSQLAVTTANTYKFQPTDVMGVDRLRVIARAQIGGNPATDSDPSGEVLMIFDSNYTSNGHSWIEKDEHQNGSHWNFNTSTWGFTSLDDAGNGGYGMASFSFMCIGGQCGSWPNSWCAFITMVPDIVDQDAAYVDMYYSQQSWGFGNTAAMALGTSTNIPDNTATSCDFNPTNDHKAFATYTSTCAALDTEFCETGASGFTGYLGWTHTSYWLNDLLDNGDRDYFGMGWANGPTDGGDGYGFNDAQVIVVY